MAKGSFLSGLIGVAVGALIATLFHSGENPGSAPRSESARLERAIARLESALLRHAVIPRGDNTLNDATNANATGARGGRAARDGAGATADDDVIGRPAFGNSHIDPARIRAMADEGGSIDVLRSEVEENYPAEFVKAHMFWSYQDVVRKYGMPTRTRIANGHPAFVYGFKGTNRSRTIMFTFIDGIVFQVLV